MALAKPTQITVPFSSNGVKNTIPETATGSNLASMQEGFPVITMTDVDQGGMPPQGQDMNGILFDVTTAIRYQQAGGLFPFDATFAQTVDGYPLGALLTAADGSCLYQNTVSGNVSDPENGGQGWSQILSSASIAGKQDKLTPVQMDAVNSGITSARVAIYDSYANGKQDALTFDNTPTNGSSNPVTSDGIYTALGTKQDTITFDATPQSGSTNPVKSGGVYDALAEKVNIDNAGNAEVTATGSTTAHTLADWMEIVQKKETENATYRKRLSFKTPASFSDEAAAISALSTASGQTITSLFPQTATLCDGMLYVMYWGYTSSGAYSGHVLLVVFNYSTGGYVRYHILAGARNAEALVVKTEGADKFVYVESTALTIYRYRLDTTNGSSLTKVDDGNEAISSGIFFSYRNGIWCVLNTSNQVSGAKPAGWSLYDDDWNIKRQIGWRPFEFDFLTNYSEQDANQMAIPHLQGVELGDDGLYLFKGGASNYEASYPDVSAIGVQQMDFFGDIKRSSLCNSVKFRSAVSAVVGGTVSRSEGEGGFITEDGRVFSTAILDINNVRTITVFEEFSSSPDAVDFSACAFIPSNIPYLINTMQMPKGKDGYLYNPFTGEVLTGLADVIKMAYKFGLDRFVFSPYGLTTSPQEWTTLYNVNVCSDTAYSAEIVRNTGSTFFLRIRSTHNSGSSGMSAEYYVGVDSSGTVNYCQPSAFYAQMLRSRRLYLGTSDADVFPLWNSNGTLQWNSQDIVAVVESGTNYKRYSDGTQECWGGGTTSSTPTAINFPKAFSEAPTVVISGQSGSVDMQMRFYKAAAVSASGFTPVATNITATSYSAVTYRYQAKGKWSA